MKTLNLFLLFFFLFALNSYSLPECTGKDSSAWDLCIGKSRSGEYVGEWKDGKKHGQGTEIGGYVKYVGEFKDDKYHGKGTYTYQSFNIGWQCVGEFKLGRSHGQATITYPNGSKYVGEWYLHDGGKRHGKGTMIYSDSGREVSGRWYYGKFIK